MTKRMRQVGLTFGAKVRPSRAVEIGHVAGRPRRTRVLRIGQETA